MSMDLYLWAFVGLLYFIASGKPLFAVCAFTATAVASYYPKFSIPVFMLIIMYLALFVVRLLKSLEVAKSQLDTCVAHMEALHSQHESSVQNVLAFTKHIKSAFARSPKGSAGTVDQHD